MNKTLVIARKEFRELLANRSTVLTALGVSVFFSFIYSMALREEGAAGGIISVDGILFFLSTMLGVFMAFSLTGHAFYKEKTERIIETLLSAPVSVLQVWLGKIIGVTFLSYLLALLSMVLLIVFASVRNQVLLLPGGPVAFHILFGVPLFIAAFVGISGLAQLALGMRENRFLNFLLFIPLFAGLYGIGYSIGAITEITWLYTILVIAVALLLILVSSFVVRLLSRERIVNTLG